MTLKPGSCPPSPGLAPWATLISISRQLFRYSAVTPKRPEAICLIAEDGVVAVGARLVARRDPRRPRRCRSLRADAVHGDGQRLVRLGRQRAERDAGRDQALADLGDAFDLVDRAPAATVAAEVQQVAQADRRQLAHAFGVAAVELRSCRWRPRSAACGSASPSKACASPPRRAAVEAADRQRDDIGVPGAGVHAPAPWLRCRRGRCRRCATSCRGRIRPPGRATGRPPRSCSRRDRTRSRGCPSST